MKVQAFPPGSYQDYGANATPPPNASSSGFLWSRIVVALAYAASITFDLSPYTAYGAVVIDITLTGNLAFNLSNGKDGQVIILRLLQDGTGSRTWTPGAAIRFSTDITSITLTTTLNKLDRISLEWIAPVSKADVTAYNKGY